MVTSLKNMMLFVAFLGEGAGLFFSGGTRRNGVPEPI
jgi:hypothetical protein